METIQTRRGKTIYLTAAYELWDAHERGEWIRAYCHIHQGDHQRSLSINKCTGWGRCFQCQALVLVEEYNPATAADLRKKTRSVGSDLPLRHTLSKVHPIEKSGQERHHDTWQQEEAKDLRSLHARFRAALLDVNIGDGWQAQAYLHTRGISLDLASHAGIGYVSRELLEAPDVYAVRTHLARWTERLLFPLRSPTGNGYIGRSLWHWQIGMDENVHKAILEASADAPKRWIKTNPAGWFCVPPVDFATCIILVEGGFDRLALLEAGFADNEVVALVGTAAQADWFPAQVKGILLALDSDPGGLESIDRLIGQLADFELMISPPPNTEDHLGKDWSERYRTSGHAGVEPLFAALTHLKQIVDKPGL